MNVRAKFICEGVVDDNPGNQKTVHFRAVTDGSEENKSFAKYTPSGQIQMVISNETEAAGAFEQGKAFFVDFSPAD